MSLHTPGPWFISNGIIVSPAGNAIARIASNQPPIVRLDNARLIAGAPNLLAALKRLSFAALARDATMGDQCRLVEVRAELAAANIEACAAIASVTGSAPCPAL